MTADGVEAQPWRAPIVCADENRHASQHILKDRLSALEMPLELHPQLGQRAAPQDDDLPEYLRADQTSRDRQGMDGATAEPFDVRTGRHGATAHFRHRLGQVPAATLVTIANCFFAAV